MPDKAKDLGEAGRRLTAGMRVRDDDTVAAAASGGVRGGRTAGGKVKIAAYVAPELHAALEAMSEEQDRSISWLVADALRAYVTRKG